MRITAQQAADSRRLLLFSPLLCLYALSVVLLLMPYIVVTGRALNGYEYTVGVAGLSIWTGAVAALAAFLLI